MANDARPGAAMVPGHAQKWRRKGPGRTQAAAGATTFSGEWLDKGSAEQVMDKRNPSNAEDHQGREEMERGEAEGLIRFHAGR